MCPRALRKSSRSFHMSMSPQACLKRWQKHISFIARFFTRLLRRETPTSCMLARSGGQISLKGKREADTTRMSSMSSLRDMFATFHTSLLPTALSLSMASTGPLRPQGFWASLMPRCCWLRLPPPGLEAHLAAPTSHIALLPSVTYLPILAAPLSSWTSAPPLMSPSACMTLNRTRTKSPSKEMEFWFALLTTCPPSCPGSHGTMSSAKKSIKLMFKLSGVVMRPRMALWLH